MSISPRRFRRLFLEQFEERSLLALAIGGGFAVGGVGGNGNTSATQVGVDAAGNIYLAGEFSGTVDFSEGAGADLRTSLGNTDAYVAKYSPLGELQWVQTWGNAYFNDVNGMAVDAAGNVHIIGTFLNLPVDFDPGPDVELRTPKSADSYLLKLNSDGEFQYVDTWGAGFYQYSVPEDVGVDAAGNAYVLMNYTSHMDFGSGWCSRHCALQRQLAARAGQIQSGWRLHRSGHLGRRRGQWWEYGSEETVRRAERRSLAVGGNPVRDRRRSRPSRATAERAAR